VDVKVLSCLIFTSFFVGIFSFGGWVDVDKDGQDAKNIAKIASSGLEAENNGYKHRFVVKNVQKQIVAGWNWKIELTKEKTQCESGSLTDVNNCIPTGNVDDCTVMIYENLQGETEVTSSKCITRPQALGGVKQGDKESESALKVAQLAIEDFNQKSNDMYMHKLIKIESITEQVVQGKLYKIIFTVGKTECRKNFGELQLSRCAFVADDPSEGVKASRCTAKVMEQLWKPNPYNIESNCEAITPLKISTRPRRSLTVNMNQDTAEDAHRILFNDFKSRYNKVYQSKSEEAQKYEIFKQNMKKIHHLQATERGSGRYGATQFADISESEFRRKYLSPVWKKDTTLPEAEIPNVKAPTSFDWRQHGAVTEVKNQGQCGSCWAFSTTGNIEGQWYLKKKKLVSLSEQELVDCDRLDQGCGGGLPSNAYKEIIRIGGLEAESDYPYEGHNNKCSFVKSKSRVYINSSVAISQDEEKIAAWLAQNGPVSIGINAAAMQFYFGGISHPWKIFCNPKSLDHGVLLVGYGVKGSEPYWIVKNSWGPSWGEQGYYLVYRGDGVCGLNTMCTSAVVN